MDKLQAITLILMLIGIALAIQWVFSIIDVLSQRFKNDSNKIIWIIMLIFVPPIGTFLYMFMRESQVIKKLSLSEISVSKRNEQLNNKDENWI